MSLRTVLRVYMTQRRLLKLLERLTLAQERQTALLERLTNQWAPPPRVFQPEDLAVTVPVFSRDEEHARIQAYIERCQADLQRAPTDEEIVRFLDGVETRL